MEGPALSIVLPCYNEEANLDAVVRSVVRAGRKLCAEFEVVAVNDGSRDATGAVLARLADELPGVRVVTHAVNRGYGAALRSGFAASRGAWVVFMDADGQFDPEDIGRLWSLRGPALGVVGQRRPRADRWPRILNAWLWGRLVQAVMGVGLRDLDCGFKLFPGRELRSVAIEHDGATLNAEILWKLKQAGIGWSEVAVTHLPRRAGRATGATLRVILKALADLARLRFPSLREDLLRFARFALVGTLNTALDLLLFAGLVAAHPPDRDGFLAAAYAVAGWGAGSVCGYLLHSGFTFRSRLPAAGFYAVSLAGLAVQVGATALAASLFGTVGALAGKVAGVALAAAGTYGGYLWLSRRAAQPSSQAEAVAWPVQD